MDKKRILLVDDEEDILVLLAPILKREGYLVQTATSGKEALSRYRSSEVDLVVLDVDMPEMDGREVLRQLRQNKSWVGVIMLTKLKGQTERIRSLDEGADDYIDKPFDTAELLVRIKSLLRRMDASDIIKSQLRKLSSSGLVIDRIDRKIWINGQEVELQPRAFDILVELVVNAGEVVSRDQLLDKFWGISFEGKTRAIDARISDIRQALGTEIGKQIVTEIGAGYRFVGEVKFE